MLGFRTLKQDRLKLLHTFQVRNMGLSPHAEPLLEVAWFDPSRAGGTREVSRRPRRATLYHETMEPHGTARRTGADLLVSSKWLRSGCVRVIPTGES